MDLLRQVWPMKKTTSEDSLSALLVGIYESDRLLVHEVFERAGWRLVEAWDRVSGLRCLMHNRIHVVIAGKDLPNWPWKKVLDDLHLLAPPPQLIVTATNADDYFWAEALNIGAFDVLHQPFHREEVERAVAAARRRFDHVSVGRPRTLAMG